jgi:hypothetical protein
VVPPIGMCTSVCLTSRLFVFVVNFATVNEYPSVYAQRRQNSPFVEVAYCLFRSAEVFGRFSYAHQEWFVVAVFSLYGQRTFFAGWGHAHCASARRSELGEVICSHAYL